MAGFPTSTFRSNCNLAFDRLIEDVGGGAVGRVVGSTTVTGTATSGDGVYDIDLMI